MGSRTGKPSTRERIRRSSHSAGDLTRSHADAWPVLEGQRHTRGPDAAHPDAEKRTEREQHPIARRKAAQKSEHRIPDDREHERRLPAPTIGSRAGSDASDHSADERDRSERAEEPATHREASLDVGEQESENGEVETVEGPAEKCRRERLPLIRGDLPPPGGLGGRRHEQVAWIILSAFRRTHGARSNRRSAKDLAGRPDSNR
jgi:hypothetical protein